MTFRTVNIDGQNIPIQWEVTTTTIRDEYIDQLQILIDTLKLDPNGKAGVNKVDQAMADRINRALRGLADLTFNGSNVGGTQSYMTIDMARNLDALFRAMGDNGMENFLTNPNASLTPGQIETFLNKAAGNPALIQSIFTTQSAAVNSTQSLQALVQINFVRHGNETIGNALSGMQDALNISREVTDLLTRLQNFQNQTRVLNDAKLNQVFNFDLTSVGNFPNPSAWIGELIKQGDQVFGQPISPQLIEKLMLVPENEQFIRTQIKDLFEIRDGIKAQMTKLEQTMTKEDLENPNGLYQRLSAVYNDLNTAFGGVTDPNGDITKLYQGFSSWVLDSSNSLQGMRTATGGRVQDNISAAFTAASSLQTSQKEQVNRYLFLFEQFYNTASNVLRDLNDMIRKFATNMNSR